MSKEKLLTVLLTAMIVVTLCQYPGRTALSIGPSGLQLIIDGRTNR